MSARRRNDVVVVDDDDRQKGMVDIFMDRHKHELELLAPLVGAAVGAMALEAASQHINMKKHEVALVGAGIALLTGANAKGPARQLAMGAAAGAACYGLVEVLRQGHPAWLYKDPPTMQPQRQAAPADGNDLQNAQGQLQQRHEAELAAREAAHAEQMRQMKAVYEAQIGEMKSTMHALLNELRTERGEPPIAPPIAPPVIEAPPAPPSNDNSRPKTTRNIATTSPAASVTLAPQQTAHFAAIYAMLTA